MCSTSYAHQESLEGLQIGIAAQLRGAVRWGAVIEQYRQGVQYYTTYYRARTTDRTGPVARCRVSRPRSAFSVRSNRKQFSIQTAGWGVAVGRQDETSRPRGCFSPRRTLKCKSCRFSSVTLCACICLLQIVTYTSYNLIADVLARLETPRPRCARSDDESTCLW